MIPFSQRHILSEGPYEYLYEYHCSSPQKPKTLAEAEGVIEIFATSGSAVALENAAQARSGATWAFEVAAAVCARATWGAWSYPLGSRKHVKTRCTLRDVLGSHLGTRERCAGAPGSHFGVRKHCTGALRSHLGARKHRTRRAREPLRRSKTLHRPAQEPLGRFNALQKRAEVHFGARKRCTRYEDRESVRVTFLLR